VKLKVQKLSSVIIISFGEARASGIIINSAHASAEAILISLCIIISFGEARASGIIINSAHASAEAILISLSEARA